MPKQIAEPITNIVTITSEKHKFKLNCKILVSFQLQMKKNQNFLCRIHLLEIESQNSKSLVLTRDFGFGFSK